MHLNDYLLHVKCKVLKLHESDWRISYSHAKYRYQLEVESDLVEGWVKKPDFFEFTSAKPGFERFHTQKIKSLVFELELAEEKLKEAMTPFLVTIFSRFHESRDIWTRVVNIITELDCLSCLSIASCPHLSMMPRPIFVESS